MKKSLIAFLILLCGVANAQQQKVNDSIMITVLLKHQQDKSQDSIQKKLDQSGFWKSFPPKSSRVVSWYVMMGIGQVVTLKLPAADLRTLNLSVERGAWGAFNTEFYPTYDYEPIWEQNFKSKREQVLVKYLQVPLFLLHFRVARVALTLNSLFIYYN